MLKPLIEKFQQLLPQKKIQVDLRDKLLLSTVPYYLLTIITLSGYFAMDKNSYLFIVIVYAILPVVDEIFSLDWRNPTAAERKKLEENDIFYKIAIYSASLSDWFIFFHLMNYYSQYDLSFYSLLNLLGMIYGASNLNAAQFAVAHEIFHKSNRFHRIFGTLIMSKLLYMHFTYEHIWGHHRRVATPEDPASAEKGITVYRFILRSFFGSYKSVYKMEAELGKPFYKNCSVLSVAAAIGFTALMFGIYGFQAGCLFVINALGAIAYLEAINYIEHYGLRREKLDNGEYQKVTIRHSWNASHRVSNYLLFKLQRHSDHHENCLKPYQTLVALEDSPQLSHGYTLTILMSFFPSVWFSIMDPLVDEYRVVKTGAIDSEIRALANRKIRKFIIEVAVTIISIFLLNSLLMSMRPSQSISEPFLTTAEI